MRNVVATRSNRWMFLFALSTMFAELMYAQILGLKTWNHLVYIAVSTCILGLGIGVNLHHLLRRRCGRLEALLPIGALVMGLCIVFSTYALIPIPLPVAPIFPAAGFLALSIVVLLGPFVTGGFLISVLFSGGTGGIGTLYLADLLGAATGCAVYFAFIKFGFAVRGLVFIAILMVVAAASSRAAPGRLRVTGWVAAGVFAILAGAGEPRDFAIEGKGWESFPSWATPGEDVRFVTSQWHPLGRLDSYEIVNPKIADELYEKHSGTFQIPVLPRLPFVYSSNNFLSGTPAFAYLLIGPTESPYRIVPFSTPMELPYVLLRAPKVMVIGAGGGRDIFVATVHGASGVAGAEVNEVTYRAMMPEGILHEYTGGVYTLAGVRVENIDGRRLARKNREQGFDLVQLNGVDMFSGLAAGFYAYAESYLYTTEALRDYLRTLSPNGIVNLNRIFFGSAAPRETLRVFTMALDALRDEGHSHPTSHVFVAATSGWGITLIKRSPFRADDVAALHQFLSQWPDRVEIVYDPLNTRQPRTNKFHAYADAFEQGRDRAFLSAYPFDVSPVADDRPFFYKQYKFNHFAWWAAAQFLSKGPRWWPAYPGSPVVLVTQIILLGEALFLAMALIGLPLVIFRGAGVAVPRLNNTVVTALLYFLCLGIGFMFIEIALIQKTTLLVEAPQNALPIVIGALLVSAGLGSHVSDRPAFLRRHRLFGIGGVVVIVAWVGALVLSYEGLSDWLLGAPFAWRAISVALGLLPLGFCLGLFFPVGLTALGRQDSQLISWGWAMNVSFSVVGTVLSVIVSQFLGFNVTLGVAAALYAMVALLLLTSRSNFLRVLRTAPGTGEPGSRIGPRHAGGRAAAAAPGSRVSPRVCLSGQ